MVKSFSMSFVPRIVRSVNFLHIWQANDVFAINPHFFVIKNGITMIVTQKVKKIILRANLRFIIQFYANPINKQD